MTTSFNLHAAAVYRDSSNEDPPITVKFIDVVTTPALMLTCAGDSINLVLTPAQMNQLLIDLTAAWKAYQFPVEYEPEFNAWAKAS